MCSPTITYSIQLNHHLSKKAVTKKKTFIYHKLHVVSLFKKLCSTVNAFNVCSANKIFTAFYTNYKSIMRANTNLISPHTTHVIDRDFQKETVCPHFIACPHYKK